MSSPSVSQRPSIDHTTHSTTPQYPYWPALTLAKQGFTHVHLNATRRGLGSELLDMHGWQVPFAPPSSLTLLSLADRHTLFLLYVNLELSIPSAVNPFRKTHKHSISTCDVRQLHYLCVGCCVFCLFRCHGVSSGKVLFVTHLRTRYLRGQSYNTMNRAA
uniref:Uncharacterized protein n=1 Tax=Trypanosoma vivax (strain Y486) TaxID=1055687 RepID=G0TUJ1_TRYVY|nr:hypothetical protein, unlikely [Trypanosoma vivax Y486]